MKRKTKYTLIVLLIFTFNTGCAVKKNNTKLELVDSVNIEKYRGKWYEIARLPFRAEKGLVNVTATYSISGENRIKVVNKGYKNNPEGKVSKIEGTAWRPDRDIPGKLKVRFFWPFAADYNIIALDQDNYNYALVAGSSGKYAWILSRKPRMDDAVYSTLLKIAEKNGIDPQRFIKVQQEW